MEEGVRGGGRRWEEEGKEGRVDFGGGWRRRRKDKKEEEGG